MDRNSIYYKQVQLLMQVLPFVAKQECFALKVALSTVLRGTVYEPELMEVCAAVDDECA